MIGKILALPFVIVKKTIGLIFWIVILAIVFYIVLGGKREKTAMDILKERFARGDISKREFEEKKKALLG